MIAPTLQLGCTMCTTHSSNPPIDPFRIIDDCCANLAFNLPLPLHLPSILSYLDPLCLCGLPNTTSLHTLTFDDARFNIKHHSQVIETTTAKLMKNNCKLYLPRKLPTSCEYVVTVHLVFKLQECIDICI